MTHISFHSIDESTESIQPFDQPDAQDEHSKSSRQNDTSGLHHHQQQQQIGNFTAENAEFRERLVYDDSGSSEEDDGKRNFNVIDALECNRIFYSRIKSA